jgi:hypothetical protein
MVVAGPQKENSGNGPSRCLNSSRIPIGDTQQSAGTSMLHLLAPATDSDAAHASKARSAFWSGNDR